MGRAILSKVSSLLSASMQRRIAWFAVSGLIATSLHALVALTATRQFGWTAGPANGLAFIVASVASYYINTLLGAQRASSLPLFIRFCSVAAVCAVLAACIAAVANMAGAGDIMTVLIVSALMPPITFTMHTLWTYKHAH